ncbi:MAG: hypothetical protein KGH94_00325 [Candidatus Micrarchaeota archaeon]|nr:hypothetical protein [Candidatus Micrarchaeota archaeon]
MNRKTAPRVGSEFVGGYVEGKRRAGDQNGVNKVLVERVLPMAIGVAVLGGALLAISEIKRSEQNYKPIVPQVQNAYSSQLRQ